MIIKKSILLNPGPATTSDSVKFAQIVSDICPREYDFELIMVKIRIDLLKIVNAPPNEFSTILFSGSGTLCMDVLLNSLVDVNSKLLIINNGSYSSRAVDICRSYGITYIEYKLPFNIIPKTKDIDKLIKKHNINILYTTHHETGSGILNPIYDIGNLCKKYGIQFLLDTTSSFAMIPINIIDNNIDFLISSSQKGIGAMAGLSFIIGKKSLIEESKHFKTKSYYCNLYNQYEYFQKYNQMRFTPPVQTIYSVKQALEELFLEGLENKFQRHKSTFLYLKKELTSLGFKFYIPDEFSSNLLISILFPQDPLWSFKYIHDFCYERNFTIYPGKDNDKSFRLSVFGVIGVEDIKKFINVFKLALKTLGIKIPIIYN